MGLGPVNGWGHPVQPQHYSQESTRFHAKPRLSVTPSPAFGGKFRNDEFTQIGGTTASAPIYPVPKGNHKNILLPDGVPVFYLHGTWATTAGLKPIIDFISNIATRHPSYMSFIPEVKEGTGIETVDDPKTEVPAFKQALRDMGDFQYQFIHQNLRKLCDILHNPSKAARREQIGEFFRVLPDERDRLVPVLEKFLEDKVFQVPPGLNISESLFAITGQGVERVRKEFAKLRINTRDREILDTYLLYTRALVEGKRLNLNMYEVYHDPATINLRPLNLKDVSFLNAYMMYLEKELATDIRKAYGVACNHEDPSACQVKNRADKMAAKLLESFAPRGMVFGHSQGGTVLLSALLKHLAMSPKTPAEAFDLNSEDVDRLGGRFIGIGSFFSAPLHGIPEEPMWGQPIAEFFEQFEQKIRGPVRSDRMISRWLVKRIGWRYFASKGRAVQEMRAGSEMLRRFQQDINLVRNREVTLMSAHDEHDTFIEPAATILTNEEGEKFANVFNIALEMPKVTVPYEDPQDILEQEIRAWKLHPDSPVAKLLRKLPKKFHEFLFNQYQQSFSGLVQHRALLNFPTHVHQELGRKMIKDPERQTRLLDPSNFEPFRYQSLIARRKITQKQILNQPLPTAMENLRQFWTEYPKFLSALVANAKQALPLENSASYEANLLLASTLDLVARAADEPKCRAEYGEDLKKSLREIADANIPALTPTHSSVSVRAKELLGRFAH